MDTVKPISIDEYIYSFPEAIQDRLQKLRETISKAAPEAQEIISYGMPAFRLGGILVYFAAHKNHIGFYPYSSAIQKFKAELSVYKGAKGSVQFPHHAPIPFDLIYQIIVFRANENREKEALKKNKGTLKQPKK